MYHLQAMMKAKRAEDPRHYVLVEQHSATASEGKSRASRRTSARTERRVLADDENVYAVQSQWKSTGGTFTLMHHDNAEVCCVFCAILSHYEDHPITIDKPQFCLKVLTAT